MCTGGGYRKNRKEERARRRGTIEASMERKRSTKL